MELGATSETTKNVAWNRENDFFYAKLKQKVETQYISSDPYLSVCHSKENETSGNDLTTVIKA